MKIRPYIALTFLAIGLPISVLLWLFIADPPFSGWSDGSGSSSRASAAFVTLPYASFFVLGAVAALSRKRGARLTWRVVAHVMPLLSMIAGGKDGWVMLFLIIPAYVLFLAAWLGLCDPDVKKA